jgi:hypothetical protein
MSGGERAKTRPRKMTKAAATTTNPAHADAIKAFVIAHFWRLVSDGFAQWNPMRDGNVEFRLSTGEAFLLGNASITRIT